MGVNSVATYTISERGCSDACYADYSDDNDCAKSDERFMTITICAMLMLNVLTPLKNVHAYLHTGKTWPDMVVVQDVLMTSVTLKPLRVFLWC